MTKQLKHLIAGRKFAVLVTTAILWAASGAARAGDQQAGSVVVTSQAQSGAGQPGTAPVGIVIQSVESDDDSNRGKEVAWLGLGVEESPEVLSAQLGLKRGEGLTATVIAEGSPAAKADLRRNDVFVDLDGQMLVHPQQLRKLVQMHAVGDVVKLTYYRGGKRQTASVKLATTKLEEADGTVSVPVQGDVQLLQRNFQRQIQQALSAPGSLALPGALAPTSKFTQSDDTGTISIEKGANTHLTAQDTNGKILFDGVVDTPAEQKKVPKAIWAKAKPMLDGNNIHFSIGGTQVQVTDPNNPQPKADDTNQTR